MESVWGVPLFIDKAFSVLGRDTPRASSNRECFMTQLKGNPKKTNIKADGFGTRRCLWLWSWWPCRGGFLPGFWFPHSVSLMPRLYHSLPQTHTWFSKIRQLWSAHLTFLSLHVQSSTFGRWRSSYLLVKSSLPCGLGSSGGREMRGPGTCSSGSQGRKGLPDSIKQKRLVLPPSLCYI